MERKLLKVPEIDTETMTSKVDAEANVQKRILVNLPIFGDGIILRTD